MFVSRYQHQACCSGCSKFYITIVTNYVILLSLAMYKLHTKDFGGSELSWLPLKSPLVLWMFTNEHSLYASMPFPPKSLNKRIEQKDKLYSKNLALPLVPIIDLKCSHKWASIISPKLSQIGRFTQNSQSTNKPQGPL